MPSATNWSVTSDQQPWLATASEIMKYPWQSEICIRPWHYARFLHQAG